jgi:hypothetical protein
VARDEIVDREFQRPESAADKAEPAPTDVVDAADELHSRVCACVFGGNAQPIDFSFSSPPPIELGHDFRRSIPTRNDCASRGGRRPLLARASRKPSELSQQIFLLFGAGDLSRTRAQKFT